MTRNIPTIESVMTPLVYAVDIDEAVEVAEDLMIEHSIRHLAVMDADALVGIISDRDIAFTPNSAGLAIRSKLTVREICSLDVYSAEVGEHLDRILLTMSERHLGATLVTRDGVIAGIFTTTDACRCYAESLRGA
ncbi:MAG: CBS domain-containing protein [Deltaproteobacteria bacterium]|nr:CBS domain-containing protein [Deltaproteobacteria bacterium]MBW2665757.1 CBS domain-containing protein [Deltaproteobacteria bacterium]